mmetsp:Transcript_85669/g.250831  ORF Transcript_85669/g.250831 Transcript_85669/m.250831 type:complete len:209 (+) Transcript_85669:185-811(+)
MLADSLLVGLRGARLPVLNRKPVNVCPLLPLSGAKLVRLLLSVLQALPQHLLLLQQFPELPAVAQLQGGMLTLQESLVLLQQFFLLFQDAALASNQLLLLLYQLGLLHDLPHLLRWPVSLLRRVLRLLRRVVGLLRRVLRLLRRMGGLGSGPSRRSGLGRLGRLGRRRGAGEVDRNLPAQGNRAEQQPDAHRDAARRRRLGAGEEHRH